MQRDRQRSTYGVKEQNLAKLYIDALGLDKHFSADANRLLNWKQPAPGEVRRRWRPPKSRS
jgi:DNA ligase-4